MSVNVYFGNEEYIMIEGSAEDLEKLFNAYDGDVHWITGVDYKTKANCLINLDKVLFIFGLSDQE